MTAPQRIGDNASHAESDTGKGRRPISFARGSRHHDGFGWLGEDGRIDPGRPVETYITGRMGITDNAITRVGFERCAVGVGEWAFVWGEQDDLTTDYGRR